MPSRKSPRARKSPAKRLSPKRSVVKRRSPKKSPKRSVLKRRSPRKSVKRSVVKRRSYLSKSIKTKYRSSRKSPRKSPKRKLSYKMAPTIRSDLLSNLTDEIANQLRNLGRGTPSKKFFHQYTRKGLEGDEDMLDIILYGRGLFNNTYNYSKVREIVGFTCLNKGLELVDVYSHTEDDGRNGYLLMKYQIVDFDKFADCLVRYNSSSSVEKIPFDPSIYHTMSPVVGKMARQRYIDQQMKAEFEENMEKMEEEALRRGLMGSSSMDDHVRGYITLLSEKHPEANPVTVESLAKAYAKRYEELRKKYHKSEEDFVEEYLEKIKKFGGGDSEANKRLAQVYARKASRDRARRSERIGMAD